MVGNKLAYSRFGYTHLCVVHELDNDVLPSWSTHEQGYYCLTEVLTQASGWGMSSGTTIILINDCCWIKDNLNPVAYRQMMHSSYPVFYLRGGGIYNIYSNENTTWTVHTSLYEHSQDTVQPETSCPSNVNPPGTIKTNINGIATKVSSALTVGGKTYDGSKAVTLTAADLGALTTSTASTTYATKTEMNAKNDKAKVEGDILIL